MTHTDLIARLRLKGIQTNEKPNHHIRRMEVERIEAANALTAAQERIEALEGALIGWNTAFGVADGYAVAIHDADGKCYSVRAQDYNVLHDLYRSRAALDAGRDG